MQDMDQPMISGYSVVSVSMEMEIDFHRTDNITIFLLFLELINVSG